jgi:hypothetical protein
MDPLDSRLWQIEKALELIRKEASDTRRAIEKLLEVVKGGK